MNKDELEALEEAEQAARKNKCINCGARQRKLVLVLEGNRRTHNYIGACQNSQCFRYTDTTQTPSWVPA